MTKKLKDLTEYKRGQVSHYRPALDDMLIKHLGNGNSVSAFCFAIGITKSTFNDWLAKHPEFKEAYEIAKLGEQATWEDMAKAQANGDSKGSGTTLQFMMKNKFNDEFKDKQEVEHTGNVVFQIDTGIKRPGDIGFSERAKEIEAEFKPLEQSIEKTDGRSKGEVENEQTTVDDTTDEFDDLL